MELEVTKKSIFIEDLGPAQVAQNCLPADWGAADDWATNERGLDQHAGPGAKNIDLRA
jgi:hypothetical protein